ncbi:Cadherin-87A [Gryllus bimaculatus]|nr:Cadherin-87A [Gryllus bimaculatus]
MDGDDKTFGISTVNGKGVIRLLGELDYERKFLYQLRVLAIDRANNGRVNTGTAALLVQVQDVEDQPPVFVAVSPVTRVSEDARVGTSVLQVKAIDGDRGINNPVTYSLVPGAQTSFNIDPKTGIIFTQEKLDRESPDNSNGAYILKIIAQENSKVVSPPPTASTEVTIIITDINDEIPTFRSPFYEAVVNENAQTNTPITFLKGALPQVYDHDQGNNGTFQMFLDGDKGIFEVTPPKGINEASFLIRVKDPTKLDFEKLTFLNFSIIAKEMVLNNPKYSLVPVTVHIKDMNDNFPEFTQPYYEVSVRENADVGTTVAWIQALDDDSGNFGTQGIRYTSLGGSMSDLLSLDPVTGIITIKSTGPSFDRELVSRHYLTVEARDDLGNGNRNSVQLVVNIEDVNDNPPIFLRTKYEARLFENSIDFESPLLLEAHDNDLNGTQNSKIQFRIASGDPFGNFSIDPTLGLMQPLTPIDFEQLLPPGKVAITNVLPLNLVVLAHDMGDPSLASEVPVVIYVQDINDHAPLFEHSQYARSIHEDMLGGSSIMQVKAWDDDGSSPNNVVVYRIQEGAEDKFVIDAETGVVSVAHGANLDPDRTDPKTTRYTLRVVALDGGIGEEQLQALAIVNISIIDVNNKVPVFLDPGVLRVKENTQVGQYIHKIQAIDPDDKPILRYRLDASNSEARSEEGTLIKSSEYDFMSMFELDPISGYLRVVKILDRERVETIRLGLTVEDLAAAKGKQVSSAILTIIIEDENDNNPKFRRPFYRRSVTENSKNGVTIINIVADDADKNRTITYSLEGPRSTAEFVHLDEDTGEVVVASKIDREQTPWLNFTVRATDSGFPPRSSLADVFIQILDENDNNPFFIGDLNNITVREDAPVGTEIAVIEAQDPDVGDFGKITFLLDRMSSQGKFQINAETGILSVADVLNREEQSSYLLIIEAWDNYQFGYATGESRNAFKQIGVNVVDVNDETPVFEIIYGCVTVNEFHPVREVVTAIKASDADDPNTPNGRIKFSIIDGNEQGMFKIENIDFTTARIVTLKSLKKLYGNYTLKIQAQDLGIPPNSATMDLEICVTDFNDNAPRFVNPTHNITIRVPENATIGSTIIEVKAEDDDIGPNAAIRYRLKPDSTNGWKTFSINDKTGVVVLKEPLDRERQKIYQVRVEAYDLGIPTALSSDLELTIYVRNVNDYEPQFLVNEFFVNFTEHAAPSSEKRLLVETVDRDEVDELDDPPTPVCYYIVIGNENELFSLDAVTHELTVMRELDREQQERHVLVVKATEDCLEIPTNISAFDPSDDTLLKVIIQILDINDNPPHFVKKVFTGGVSTDADFGTEFMQVKATDADVGENAVVKYFQIGRIQKSLTEGLENIQKPPFLVNENTGAVALNFDPQKGMKGYFDFMVLANDTDGLQDMARVYIYLLREDQRVKFVLRQQPAEIREKIDILREVLSNVTGAIVNVDEYKIHENHDGSVDKTKTDLYIHLVNRDDNSIMEVTDVLRLVDENIELLDALFKEFNVLDTQPAEALALKADTEGLMMIWLVGTTIFLGLLLILVLSICLSQRARYKRQLKAATVAAFGSNESGLNHATGGQVPNTNMHSVEGSNPMWMRAYENEWYKEDESVSTSERDSLDENAVGNEEARTNMEGSKPFCIYNGGSSNNVSNLLPEGTAVKERNDLNRSVIYHENLYQHLDKISNPLIAKKLETTEL